MSRRLIKRWLIALWILLIPSQSIAATLCVNPAVEACYSTIQEAVNNANPNDIILISPHPDVRGYRENITITTPDLTLRGDTAAPTVNILEQACPEVIFDGCETPNNSTGCGEMVVAVEAPNTRIERILLRNGYISFSDTGSGADGSVFGESCVIGTQSRPLRTSGTVDDLVVEGTVFHGGTSDSIKLDGNGIIVRHNHFLTVDNGVEISGDNMLISHNEFRICNDECLDLSGNNAQIEHNRLFGGDKGIHIFGDNPSITDNIVEHFVNKNLRILCVSGGCTGGTVSRNRIIGSTSNDELLWLNSIDGFVIEDNYLALASKKGIELNGSNNIIRRNVMYRSGTQLRDEACFDITGSNNLIEDNEARWCTSNGFRQGSGSDNVYRNNLVLESGRSGIYIRTSNAQDTTLEGNQIIGAHGAGIANDGTRTVIDNNILTDNRIDMCNNGSIATFSDNTFTTGGAEVSCISGIK